MITDNQKEFISKLLSKFQISSTDSLIGHVADTDGLLVLCRELVEESSKTDSQINKWLEVECQKRGVDHRTLLYTLEQIVILFDPRFDTDDPYELLEVTLDSSPEEIKQAYRKLSRKYHPDTASADYRDDPERFIKITKAYHTLTSEDMLAPSSFNSGLDTSWRKERQRSVSKAQRKRVYFWGSLLIIVLLMISLFVAAGYRKKTMLVALQESRGAFIPPTRVTTPKLNTLYQQVNDADQGGNQAATVKKNDAENEAKVASAVQIVTKDQSEGELGSEINQVATESVSPVSMVEIEIPVEAEPAVHFGKVIPDNDEPKPRETAPAETIEEPEQNVEQTDSDVPVEYAVSKDKEGALDDLNLKSLQETELAKSKHIEDIKETSEKVTKFAESSSKEQSEETNSDQLTEATSLAVSNIEPEDDVGESIAHQQAFTQSQTLHIENQQAPEEIGISEVKAIDDIDPPPSLAMHNNNDVETGAISKGLKQDISINYKSEAEREQIVQASIDKFIAEYADAYQAKDLTKFIAFFKPDALENGKTFKSVIPVYKDMFESVSVADLSISVISWNVVENEIEIRGRFEIYLKYNIFSENSGSGPIHFTLSENGGLKVKELNYQFE